MGAMHWGPIACLPERSCRHARVDLESLHTVQGLLLLNRTHLVFCTSVVHLSYISLYTMKRRALFHQVYTSPPLQKPRIWLHGQQCMTRDNTAVIMIPQPHAQTYIKVGDWKCKQYESDNHLPDPFYKKETVVNFSGDKPPVDDESTDSVKCRHGFIRDRKSVV